MKNLLSILDTITLIGTSTTSLIACDNSNNKDSNNNQENPTPIVTKPLENSKWSLVNKSEYKSEFNFNFVENSW